MQELRDDDKETMEWDEQEWITAREVAQMLRMTTAWVYAETRANRIPHVPLGRYVRYRKSALAAWLDAIEGGSLTAATLAVHRTDASEFIGRRA